VVPVSRSRRARSLNVRGNIALAAALALAGFLALATTGSGGGWTRLHTWLAAAVAGTALTAVTCYALAWRRSATDSPQGESPPVSHPTDTPSLTPHEVRK
jgi:hypothetical protein